MPAGDVEVRIVNASTDLIDTAVTAMRLTAGANGKFMMTSIGPEAQQVVIVAISEA
jgi:uncharacterized protein (DUF1778 family)